MSTESVQTTRQACAVQPGAHAIARARASTLGALRALLTHDAAHARKPALSSCAPVARHGNCSQEARGAQPCAAELSMRMRPRQAACGPARHALATTASPALAEASHRRDADDLLLRRRLDSARSTLRKGCCRVERSPPSMSTTTSSASTAVISISKERRHPVLLVERAAAGTREQRP